MEENKGTITSKAEETLGKADAMMAETRLQFDTLVTMQHEERIEMQKMFNEQLEKQRKHYGNIILGLIIALVILIGGIVGGAAYILSNYDIVTGTYQEVYVGGDGSSTIEDGIHINDE